MSGSFSWSVRGDGRAAGQHPFRGATDGFTTWTPGTDGSDPNTTGAFAEPFRSDGDTAGFLRCHSRRPASGVKENPGEKRIYPPPVEAGRPAAPHP